MPDNFSVKRAVDQLANQCKMPKATPERTFASKREQMEYWLTDPILRPEAEAWAKRNHYPLDYDECGNAIRFAKDPEEFATPEVRQRRLA